MEYKTLKRTFQVFQDSPARRDDFESHRNKSLSTLLLGHHVGTAFEARKTIYATCTYQLMEGQITYLTLQQFNKH